MVILALLAAPLAVLVLLMLMERLESVLLAPSSARRPAHRRPKRGANGGAHEAREGRGLT